MLQQEQLKSMLDSKIITKEEYDVILKRITPQKSISDYTWEDIIDGCYDWCQDKYTITTIKGYRICIMKFVMYITETDNYEEAFKKKFKVYTFQDVNKFIDWMNNERLSNQTISKIKYAMIVLGNYLKTLDIDVVDVSAIKTPINPSSTISNVALREEEIYDVASSAGLKAQVMVLLNYECGLKRQELTKVKVQDFNFEKKQLFVYQDNGNIDRICILNAQTVTLITEYIKELYQDIAEWNGSRQRGGRDVREDFGYIFQTIKSAIPSPSVLQTMLKKAAKNYYCTKYSDEELANKIADFTFETIRNSKRVNLLANGKTVQQVMNIVGDRNYMSTHKFERFVPLLYRACQ